MSERLSWKEAEAVVRAFRDEHGAATDVNVATLARALGTDTAEVRRLAGRKPRFVDRSGALSALLALPLVVLGTVAMGPTLLAAHPLGTARLTPPAPTVLIVTDRKGEVHLLRGDDLNNGLDDDLRPYPADDTKL